MIPSIADCLRLMDLYRMLGNIRNHSLVVARIAEFLTVELNCRGEDIDPALTVTAAFLHDIGKTPCLDTGKDHARMGGDICRRHGHAELCPVIEQHVVLDENSFPAAPLSAKEVVYYADKRVNHDAIVSLGARCGYIMERYGGHEDPARGRLIMANFHRCREIEQGIFQRLGFAPAELKGRMANFRSSYLDEVNMIEVPGDVRV